MIELTKEDREAVVELATAVHDILEGNSLPLELAPLIWQEFRSAHAANKQQRVASEQMEIAKKAGLGNQFSGPCAMPGYYGQKL